MMRPVKSQALMKVGEKTVEVKKDSKYSQRLAEERGGIGSTHQPQRTSGERSAPWRSGRFRNGLLFRASRRTDHRPEQADANLLEQCELRAVPFRRFCLSAAVDGEIATCPCSAKSLSAARQIGRIAKRRSLAIARAHLSQRPMHPIHDNLRYSLASKPDTYEFG